jgi:hypothetical protein
MDSFFQLKAWIRTGVAPLGAQVRPTEGRCETPLSSWKTIQAFRRPAFFYCRPSLLQPERHLFRVALPRLLGGPLPRPVDGSQNLPHMARVIAHPGHTFHHQRDAWQRPQIGPKALRPGPRPQCLLHLAQLSPVQFRFATCPASAAQS